MKSFKLLKTKSTIIFILVLITCMSFMIIGVPKLLNLGKENDNQMYSMWIGFLSIPMYMMYISIIALICGMSFGVNETTFCITRPISRASYVISKICSQVISTSVFALLMCVFWQISNWICFLEKNDNIESFFDKKIGFTVMATVLPYFILNFMIISVSALSQWYFNNDWQSNMIVISTSFIVLIVVLLPIYLKSENNLNWFCYSATLTIPCGYGGIASLIAIILLAISIPTKKVRI